MGLGGGRPTGILLQGGGTSTGLHLPGGGAPVGVQDGLMEGALETQTSSATLSGKLISIRDGNSSCAFFAGWILYLFLLLVLVVRGHGGAVLEGSSVGELEAGGWIGAGCKDTHSLVLVSVWTTWLNPVWSLAVVWASRVNSVWGDTHDGPVRRGSG